MNIDRISGRILVEASLRDKIWDINIKQNYPDVANPRNCKRDNLLRFFQMEVRDILQK